MYVQYINYVSRNPPTMQSIAMYNCLYHVPTSTYCAVIHYTQSR